MSYKIQQLKMGGILDQAITLVKNHFGLLFQIMLMTLIPWNILSAIVQLSLIGIPPQNGSQEETVRYVQRALSFAPLLGVLSFVGLFIIMPVVNAAVIYSVAEIYLGKTVNVATALKKGLSKMGPLIWTLILMGLAIMGGIILLIIPGILFALWFGLSQHVVVLESLSGIKALSRSKQLVRPYLGTFLALGILVIIITLMISSASAFIPQVHVRLFAAVLINAIMTMFSAAVFVVFYFSCRCGVDNFDLEHLAAAVGDSALPVAEADDTISS